MDDSHNEYLSRNIATRPPRQKHNRSLEILRLPPPPHRNPLQNLPRPALIPNQRLIHIRRDIPRGNRIDVDALPGPLITQRLRQLRDSALRTRIRRDGQAAGETDQAGDVDDIAAMGTGPCEHVGAEVAAEGEDGRQVDLEDFVPVGEGELMGGVAALDACAGDEDRDVVAIGEDLRC